MRVSHKWLASLVEDLPDADEVARRLTGGGLEVEAMIRPVVDWGDHLAIATILAMEKHPDADRLTVCQVEDGGDQPRTVVCGAKNMKPGDTVVLARPGCRLPGGMEIRRSRLRGVESDGMLCSAAELGLPEDVDGILVLEDGPGAGEAAAPVLGLDDTILELGITPNRGDCLSMVGVAREIAAVCGLSLRATEEGGPPGDGDCPVPVEILSAAACPFYRGLVLRGIRVAPSPAWLRTRLAACGLRPINNVVDVTNYVLMESGQPLHAFDLGRLAGARIQVRPAAAGEKLRALDGSDLSLEAEDLVIADAESAVALAGVMGGESSAVSGETLDVFLESAMFAPSGVRRTSRRHGLLTDSSYRFERGVDPAGVEPALLRAAALLVETAGGRIDGGVARAGEQPAPRGAVLVRPARIRDVLGCEVGDENIRSILHAIGANPTAADDGFEVVPPSFRHDLSREIDFVEEVARVVGYDDIEPALPAVAMTPVAVPPMVEAAGKLRAVLSAAGLYEHIGVSFSSEAGNARFPGMFVDAAAVQVRNPLRADDTALQKSPLPSLLAALRWNRSQGRDRVDLFCVARTFGVHEEQFAQRDVVAGVLHGPRPGRRLGDTAAPDLREARAVVESVVGVLAPGAEVELTPAPERPEYHPGAAAEIRLGEVVVGFVGRLHPDLSEQFEIAGESYLFEVDCRGALAYRRAHSGLRPIPRFPSSERDVSLLVGKDEPSSAAVRAVRELDEPWIESVSVFDEYSGQGIDSGLKALGYRIVYRAPDRTLTDAEVTALHEKVVGHLEGRLGARVRV